MTPKPAPLTPKPADRDRKKPRDMIVVRAQEAIERTRDAAERSGAARLTDEEIQAEIDATRAGRRELERAAADALRAAGRPVDERALEALSREELDAMIREAGRGGLA